MTTSRACANGVYQALPLIFGMPGNKANHVLMKNSQDAAQVLQKDNQFTKYSPVRASPECFFQISCGIDVT